MVGGPEEGSAAVRTWSRLAPRSASDVRPANKRTYGPMVILLRIWKLETGVRVACGGFWGLGVRPPRPGPWKLVGPAPGVSGAPRGAVST